MDCAEARKLLPGLALGELDAEPARALQAHLEGCAGCRAERASLEATLEVLRTPEPLAGSTRRREAAVAAMAEAYAAEVERRLFLRKRRPWLAWTAAAAVLLAVAAVAALRPTGGPSAGFRAAEVRGRANVIRPGEVSWSPLSAGRQVLPGDRVITQPGAGVRFDVLEGRSDRALGQVFLDGDAAIARLGERRIALDRGRLALDLREAGPGEWVVSDTANNRVVLRQGRLEVSLREVRAVVAGTTESRGSGAAAPAPEAREEAARRLCVRVAEGEAVLQGSQDQSLVAGRGQEGDFDLGGKPATREAAAPAVPSWWERK